MPTIKDVAKLAGVSHGTVSNVLNGKVHVSPDKVEKIQKAVKELGYIPTAAARSLKSSKSMSIAVILPNITDQHYSLIYSGIERSLCEAGYLVSLYISYENPKKEIDIVQMVLQQRVDAIICCPSNPESTLETIRGINETVPVCYIEREITPHSSAHRYKYNFIGFDHEETIRKVIRSYKKTGHNSFALICGPAEFSSEADCIRGFTKECNLEKQEMANHIFQTDNNKESGFRGAIELFQSSFIPEVVICTSNALYQSTKKALEFTGNFLTLQPHIIELGDESWINNTTEKISIYRQSIKSGEMAAQLILENLENPVFHETRKILINNIITENPEETKPAVSQIHNRNVLKIAMLEGEISKAMISIIKDFEYKEGCQAEIHQFDYDELYEVTSDSSKSSEFDILQVDLPWTEEYVNSGTLLNLDDYINEVEGFKQRNIPGALEKYALFNNSYYSIPFIFGSQLLFYRKDLFEDKTLQNSYYKKYRTELRPPRNWSEFNAVARFFTRKFNPESPTQYGTTLGGRDSSGAVCETLPRIWGFKGEVFDANDEIVLTKPEAINGIKNYIESYQYAKEGSQDFWWNEQVEIFASGDSAMMILFVAHAAYITDRQHSNIVGRIGYETLPGGISLMGGWSLGIHTESKRKNTAFQFLKWISSKDIAVPYMILGGANPSNYLYNSPELNLIYPWLGKSLESFKNSRKRYVPRGNNGSFKERQFEKIFGKHINACIKHKISPEEAAEKISRELKEILS